ncbi:MAG: hypothetical protein K2F79_08305, partial [Muribaculaceae bacterium]|nr:hypothetical protein [Muribaculaceae bacterium]
MKIYKTLSLIAAGTAMCMAASCSTDEPDGPDEIIFGDFVTLTQADATGAVMDYIMPLTGKNVILSTDHKFDPDKFKDGSRIFINYRYLNGNKDNTANGPVTVLNALNVDGGGAVPSQATSEDTDGWASYPVSISYLTLTGPYLNFIYSGNSVGAPESRSFFLDSESLGKEYP